MSVSSEKDVWVQGKGKTAGDQMLCVWNINN